MRCPPLCCGSAAAYGACSAALQRRARAEGAGLMDSLRRNQYLQAIGVDVWVPRHAAAATDAARTAGTEASAAAEKPAAATVAAVVDAAATIAAPSVAAHPAVTTWESL